MNYKRKKRKASSRICKRREHKSKRVSGWQYGGQVARNIVKYNEYLQIKRQLE